MRLEDLQVINLSSSDLIALSAVVIAICALFTSVWEARIARRHNVLSVRPHIEVVVDSTPTEVCVLSFKNGGLGPAMIDAISFHFEGATYQPKSVDEYIRFLQLFAGVQMDGVACYSRCYVPDRQTVVLQGETLELFSISGSNTDELYRKVSERLPKLGISVGYQCMYGLRHAFTKSSAAGVA